MKKTLLKAILLAMLILSSSLMCACDEIFYSTPVIKISNTAKDQNTMPDLSGKTLDEANKSAQTYRINAIETYSADFPAGQIFDQSLKAGERVIPGSIVDVYVSKGVKYETIPDVSGFSYQVAKNVIESVGFKVTVVYEGKKGSCDDSVNSISPECNSQAIYGSEVTIKANALEPSKIKTTTAKTLVRDGTRPATSKVTY